MADWPTLTRQPCEPYSVHPVGSRDMLSDTEGGYIITRRRYSRDRRVFQFSLPNMDATDYATLLSFIAGQGRTGSFNWTNPADSTSYAVRFADLPTITFSNGMYHSDIALVEV